MESQKSGENTIETSLTFQDPSNNANVENLLLNSFEKECFDGLRVMVATITSDGLRPFEQKLREFCKDGKSVNFLIGTGMCPDPVALRSLRELRDQWPNHVSLQLVQMSNQAGLFHPKLYWFYGTRSHRTVVGSANWTGRGFATNIEAATCSDFHTRSSKHPALLEDLHSAWTRVHESCQGEDGWGELIEPTDEVLRQLESSWNERHDPKGERIAVESQQSKEKGVWPLSTESSTLIMDLTQEQGPSRISQVQPPLTVWRDFFGIEPGKDRVEYILEDMRTGDLCQRPIVGHDHNWTIEISGARVSRPAIIVIRNENDDRLQYAVYTPRDSEYDKIDEFLENHGDRPHPMQKRRQYIS